MIKRLHVLKTLRDIAFDAGATEHPDLASMARELGQAVHRDGHALEQQLAPLRARRRGFERWLVAEHAKPGISVLVLSWPANYATPVHDHGGLWGLEMSMSGALEIDAFLREESTGQLRHQNRTWLGPGDATWFDAGDAYVHRCRNLSRQESALTLHVYGGDLAQYMAYEQPGPTDHWIARPRQSELAGRLTA
jgi:predicted metal-dependent enzyme (double-stranded beta helix superfamily)